MPEKTTPTYEYEHKAYDSGFKCVCGIDEAGRGPLAGPVFAAAVVLPVDCEIPGLNDSKKLTEKKRDALFEVIIEKAIAYSVASASEKEIDEINILNATYLAMNRAFDGLSVKPDMALIDGNREPGVDAMQKTVVKGDSKSMSIAAASILAKVSRDRYMLEIAKLYPQYEFQKHKGYGTKLHYERIRENGISDVHRKTFLKVIH
ncbi:MAG: ribonuclease HII [Clostridia bacterium]|nr:ribonuclease HII [Clostridia bacterium]